MEKSKIFASKTRFFFWQCRCRCQTDLNRLDTRSTRSMRITMERSISTNFFWRFQSPVKEVLKIVSKSLSICKSNDDENKRRKSFVIQHIFLRQQVRRFQRRSNRSKRIDEINHVDGESNQCRRVEEVFFSFSSLLSTISLVKKIDAVIAIRRDERPKSSVDSMLAVTKKLTNKNLSLGKRKSFD
jgi:hypothetical protein